MNISLANLEKMTRWEVFQFLADVLKFADSQTEEMPELLTNQLAELQTAFEAYDEALVQERRISPEGLTEADDERDYAVRKLFNIAREYSDYSFDEEREIAANAIVDVFKSYGTGYEIAKMGQDTETAVITNLLQDLKKTPTMEEHITTLDLDPVIDNLHNSNSTFESIQHDRRNKQSEFVTGVVKSARVDAQREFLSLVDIINALSIVEGKEKYTEFKQKITGYLKYYLDIIDRRLKRNK